MENRTARWLLSTLRTAGWAPVAVLVLHVVAAGGFRVYQRFPNFDMLMHLLGGMSIAYLVHTFSLRGSALGTLAPFHWLTHALLIVGLTCVVALGWEFAEYLADRYLGTHMQGLNVTDTMQDLALGMTGGLLFLAAAWFRGVRRGTAAS